MPESRLSSDQGDTVSITGRDQCERDLDSAKVYVEIAQENPDDPRSLRYALNAIENARQQHAGAVAELGALRAGVSFVRGMCSDGEPLELIDAKLGEILNGGAGVAEPEHWTPGEPEPVHPHDPILFGHRWREALEKIARLPYQYPDDPEQDRKMALDSIRAQEWAREALNGGEDRG